MKNLPNRKRLRLPDYDYTQNGYYFVTLCTQNRQKLFDMSTVVDVEPFVVPSEKPQNKIIEKWLAELSVKFNVIIDRYVIMPGHIHFILIITDQNHSEQYIAERHTGRSLPDMMQWFKTMTTNEYIRLVKENVLNPFDKKIWQKSYYEHIIRNETDYIEIVEYILNNPIKAQIND